MKRHITRFMSLGVFVAAIVLSPRLLIAEDSTQADEVALRAQFMRQENSMLANRVKELEAAQGRQSNLQVKLDQAQATVVTLKSQNENLTKEKQALQEQLVKLQRDNDALVAAQTKMSKNLDASRKPASSSSELAALMRENESLKIQINDLERVAQMNLSKGKAPTEIAGTPSSERMGRIEKENDQLYQALEARTRERNALIEKTVALRNTIEQKDKEKAIVASMSAGFSQARAPGAAAATSEHGETIAHVYHGYAYGLQGKLKEGLSEYQAALKLEPENKDVHYNCGYILTRLNRAKEAADEYQKAVTGTDADRDIFYNLAVLYGNALNDMNRAQTYYQKYMNIIHPQQQAPAAQPGDTKPHATQ